MHADFVILAFTMPNDVLDNMLDRRMKRRADALRYESREKQEEDGARAGFGR